MKYDNSNVYEGEPIFANQTNFEIELEAGVDIASAGTLKIKYKKPDNVTVGELTATEVSPVDGIVKYVSQSTDDWLNVSGTWRFWVYVVFSDGRDARGKDYIVEVLPEE